MEADSRTEAERKITGERDLYQAFFQNLAGPSFVVDHSMRLIAVNKAFERFFGVGEDGVKGEKCRDVVNCGLCEKCPLLHAMKAGGPFADVEVSMGTGGNGKDFLMSGYFLEGDGRGSSFGVVVFHDITGRLKMEVEWKSAVHAAVEEKNTLDTIIAALGEGVSIQDTQYRILYQNRCHREMVGDHVGEYCFKAYRNMDQVCEGCHLAVSFKEGGICKKEQSRLTDRGTVNYEIISSPLRDVSGQIVAGIELVRDITERKKVEEELRMHKYQLEKLVEERAADFQTAINFLKEEINFRKRTEQTLRKNEAKMRHLHGMKVLGELAAGVAHEVRNPLHALVTVTEALKDELKDNPDFDIYLFHIRKQVERLSLLMKDLLDLGKPIEPSNLRAEPLSEICLAAIDLWKNSPSRREHTVSFVRPPSKESFVVGDSQRLQQVFLNLLENAANHSPDGSDIRVEISAPNENTDENIIRVNVVDRGAGIPEERLHRIFEPFFTTRRGGTGLGLSIIKNILDGHDGSLAIRNNGPLPGCTAEVTLPLAKEAKQ